MVQNRSTDLARIVAQAQLGDHAAFDVLYDRFADALFRYLYARCGDAALAEELLGDLWVRVVERLPGFRIPAADAEAAIAAWLYRIARNLVIDHARRKSSTNLPLLESIASAEDAPDEQVIASDEQQALRHALEQLSEDHRAVLLLRFMEERSNAEVAQLLGRTEGAIKVLQHRALGALARLLGVERGRRTR
ncbi:MAG: sigma-70 family RNA polymerase sigma factor [Chloroflexaceae bacterium]|jgi:RNA polymerase sigma-70 factor (ECF subfamily)|nr:sigma-70 family RNA polymerase sigma factor [Chloroflexaceae bacterium]